MELNSGSLRKTAKLAGALYLLLTITGAYVILFVPSRIIVKGDAAATAANMLSHEFLFRTGIIGDLVSNTVWVLLALTLYRLFRQVNEPQARLLVALVIVQIPVVFVVEALNIASLMIFKGELLKTFELGQRHDLAMFFLKINEYAMLTSEVFWGLWLIPFGRLVYASGFLPRVLGVLLMIGALGYVVESSAFLLFPAVHSIVSQYTFATYTIGEVSIMLWLLLKGVETEAKP